MDLSPGLGYFPVIWSLLTLIAFTASYGISVSNGHVYPLLPAISDTGSRSPEANVFSLFMNVSIILSLCNFAIRYYQCQLQSKKCHDDRENVMRLNKIGLLFAAVGACGALIVANVQSRKQSYMLEVHDTGAVLLFSFGGLYFWTHTILSFKMRRYQIYSSAMCYTRLALSTLVTCFSILFFTTATIGYKRFEVANNNHAVNEWVPGDGGYALHVLSNAFEWMGLLVFLLLAVTFFKEFQEVELGVECHEKVPTIVSAYDEITEYTSLQLDNTDEIQNEAKVCPR